MARTKFFHADEAAEILGMDISEVYKLLADGSILGHKLKRHWLIDMEQPCFINSYNEDESSHSEEPVYKFVKDIEHEKLFSKYLRSVKKSLHIATANFKNVHVNDEKLVTRLNDLCHKGVEVKVICARLQTSENLNFHYIVCPRNHMKLYIFDKTAMYIGSANITPAAVEDRTSKATKTNNHEAGILTTDKNLIQEALKHFEVASNKDDCKDCTIQDCRFRS